MARRRRQAINPAAYFYPELRWPAVHRNARNRSTGLNPLIRTKKPFEQRRRGSCGWPQVLFLELNWAEIVATCPQIESVPARLRDWAQRLARCLRVQVSIEGVPHQRLDEAKGYLVLFVVLFEKLLDDGGNLLEFADPPILTALEELRVQMNYGFADLHIGVEAQQLYQRSQVGGSRCDARDQLCLLHHCGPAA